MKYIVLLSALTMIGCASSKKQATPPPAAKPMAAKAAPVAPASDKITCEKGEDSRTLEVLTKGDGCTLSYTKASGTKDVANSAHGTKHCDAVKAKISGKLEKAGYKCS